MNGRPWMLAPYLRVAGASRAIAWYVDALGATEVERYPMPDGSIGHAELELHGNKLCLADKPSDQNFPAPKNYNEVPIILFAVVPDVDAVFHRAVGADAQVDRVPTDQEYGERSAGFIDPYGHVWYVSTPIAQSQRDALAS